MSMTAGRCVDAHDAARARQVQQIAHPGPYVPDVLKHVRAVDKVELLSRVGVKRNVEINFRRVQPVRDVVPINVDSSFSRLAEKPRNLGIVDRSANDSH
jgi:hypothetical protein